MNYGYARVSSKGQKLDRQLVELVKFGIEKKNIFEDKESGKDFNRKNYLRLKKKLKEGDLVVIKSIDRLGRNYSMILDEWTFLTKTVKCDVVVLDMSLLDTRVENNLIGRFIADIVLQILSFVAENERSNIKERQAEGIKLAKERGVKFGRPGVRLDPKREAVFSHYSSGEISLKEVLNILHIKRSTFYKYYNQYKSSLTDDSVREQKSYC